MSVELSNGTPYGLYYFFIRNGNIIASDMLKGNEIVDVPSIKIGDALFVYRDDNSSWRYIEVNSAPNSRYLAKYLIITDLDARPLKKKYSGSDFIMLKTANAKADVAAIKNIFSNMYDITDIEEKILRKVTEKLGLTEKRQGIEDREVSKETEESKEPTNTELFFLLATVIIGIIIFAAVVAYLIRKKSAPGEITAAYEPESPAIFI